MRQSNFPWHFHRMGNWLSLRRLVSPWAVKKCLPMRNFYVQRYVDVGVEQYSRHNLNHTDHM